MANVVVILIRSLLAFGLALSVVICDHSACWSQELIAEATPSSRGAKQTREHDDVLKFINVPTSDLPKQVRLVERIRTAPLIPVTGNPDVLVDPQLMMPVALFFGIRDKSDLEPVRVAVVAMYQENDPANEIGVYGLCFTNEEAAKKRFEKLANDKKDSPFILKGRLLLYVWKDDGVSKPAFAAVRDYLSTAKSKPADRS